MDSRPPQIFPSVLRQHARDCHRLSQESSDVFVRDALQELADEFEDMRTRSMAMQAAEWLHAKAIHRQSRALAQLSRGGANDCWRNEGPAVKGNHAWDCERLWTARDTSRGTNTEQADAIAGRLSLRTSHQFGYGAHGTNSQPVRWLGAMGGANDHSRSVGKSSWMRQCDEECESPAPGKP